MSNSKINKNSITPNGIQVDSEGYTVFYPMGTNKINIPSNSPHWPKGSKLNGSFVYDKDDKLVGFCDTKAMTAENEGIVVMPYEYIDTEFDSIERDSIQIHAPKATYKKASWTDSQKIDIPDIEYKYKGCLNMTQLRQVDENYLENDIVEGKWTELLSDMDDTGLMFNECNNIISFTSDLSSIRTCYNMFQKCINLTSFEADLSSLRDGRFMFEGCENLVNVNIVDLGHLSVSSQMFSDCHSLTKFDYDLKSLTNGSDMFKNCIGITTFKNNLKSLTNGYQMFYGCSNLSTFDSDLGSLSNAHSMFSNCSNLTKFSSDLSSLNTATNMFYNCSSISSFISKLPNLSIGHAMFENCSSLISFSSALSSLTNGICMFIRCIRLSSFNSDLSSLSKGVQMFMSCTLTSFKSNLSSLTDGNLMFFGCKLDALSVKNIIDTINTVETGEITLGMGCNDTTEDKDLFAQEVGYTDMTTLLSTLQNKGWTVSAQYNGRPSTTFSLRKPESLPVYVKLVEVVLSVNEEEISPIYEYTSSDETKFYNLDWFHETTGSTEGYDVFSSLEEAITHFNIKPIEK